MWLHSLGKTDEIEDCLKDGVDVNLKGAQNRTPLHRAVGGGYDESVEVRHQRERKRRLHAARHMYVGI